MRLVLRRVALHAVTAIVAIAIKVRPAGRTDLRERL
jgi:hypothetical protein